MYTGLVILLLLQKDIKNYGIVKRWFSCKYLNTNAPIIKPPNPQMYRDQLWSQLQIGIHALNIWWGPSQGLQHYCL